MSKKGNIFDLDAYLKKGARTIYFIYSIISCLGYSVDILNFYKISDRIFFNNLITISITFISFLLYMIKKIDLKVSFGIILYAAVINVITDSFTDPFSINRVYFFLRDSLFLIFVITLASLLVKKIHAIIISVIFASTAITLTIITKNSFLQSSISLIVLFVSVYAMVVYYFVNIIEKSVLDREIKNHQINAQNEVVNEINTLLEEKQQKIEEQSTILEQQTEQLKTQSANLILKNKELEQINSTKNLFISILAHDLKNPFNSILGFSELLETRYTNLDDNKRMHYIKTISSISKKTFTLLEDLLQWALSQSNAIDFNPKRIAINGIVKETQLFFLESYRIKKISILDNINANCYAIADENMISTVVRNLLSNAIKFTRPEGQICLSCYKKNYSINVEITDNGIGMIEEDMKNLFRIDKTHTSVGTAGETGTGLGLLLCKDFVEKNGGKIWVTSQKDIGSTFGFTLPEAI